MTNAFAQAIRYGYQAFGLRSLGSTACARRQVSVLTDVFRGTVLEIPGVRSEPRFGENLVLEDCLKYSTFQRHVGALHEIFERESVGDQLFHRNAV
jgi:hypothetical protein